MANPHDLDRIAASLQEKLPQTAELEESVQLASLAAERARLTSEELQAKVRGWNGEMAEMIGSPIVIQATERFTKLKEEGGEWVYSTPDPDSPVQILDAQGLFGGLEVMDTLAVGLPMPSQNREEESDRLVLCLSVSPATSHAYWERELVPLRSILRIH